MLKTVASESPLYLGLILQADILRLSCGVTVTRAWKVYATEKRYALGVNVTKRLRTVNLQNHTVIVVSSFHCSNNLTARSTDMWVMPQSSSGLTTQTEARQWQHRMRILQWSYAAKRNKNNEVFISIMRRKESELQTIKVAWHFS